MRRLYSSERERWLKVVLPFAVTCAMTFAMLQLVPRDRAADAVTVLLCALAVFCLVWPLRPRRWDRALYPSNVPILSRRREFAYAVPQLAGLALAILLFRGQFTSTPAFVAAACTTAVLVYGPIGILLLVEADRLPAEDASDPAGPATRLSSIPVGLGVAFLTVFVSPASRLLDGDYPLAAGIAISAVDFALVMLPLLFLARVRMRVRWIALTSVVGVVVLYLMMRYAVNGAMFFIYSFLASAAVMAAMVRFTGVRHHRFGPPWKVDQSGPTAE